MASAPETAETTQGPTSGPGSMKTFHRETHFRTAGGLSVTDITEQGVAVGETFIPTQSVFWAAGNAASPLVKSLDVPLDRTGRVLVEDDLSLPGDGRVFVIGDAAAVKQPDGRWVPGVAPAANQMGQWAAKNILRHLDGEATQPFRYFNKGDLATIGRHKAVASFFDGKLQFRGYIAWFLWLFVHIAYLVGFRNRISVLLQWAYNYIFFERSVRPVARRRVAPPASDRAEAPRAKV